jgi:hypothetical protein
MPDEQKKPDERPEGLRIEWIPPRGRGHTGTVVARNGGDDCHTDRLDIIKPAARSDLMDALANRWPALRHPDQWQTLKAELERLAADEAARVAKVDEPGDERQPDAAELLGKMPEHVRIAARAMLESPELVKRIVDDVQALGVAGERELSATLYLVGTSRLLPQPLAAIVQGPTCSGKTYVIEKVGGMFPPEAVVWATQMTPQALFHLKPGSLRHRFIVAGERSRLENDETTEATRALREVLSSGRLVKLMPMKVGGEIQTVSIQQEGPIAFCESTTLGIIFAEDANRCILLTTDERTEQTRRIIACLAAGFSGGAGEGPSQAVRLRHHALQRMLQSFSVTVPFAERLGELVAHQRVEARRAFPQLVSMIRASAVLHQRQRKLDPGGGLLAAPDDYQLARHLLARPMERLLGGRLSDPARRFLDRLREWFAPEEPFTKREVVKHETGSRSSVYGWLAELADAGAVELVEEQRGRLPAKWKLGQGSGDADEGGTLPTVEQVFPEGAWTLGHKP